jgi:hypothetical protein
MLTVISSGNDAQVHQFLALLDSLSKQHGKTINVAFVSDSLSAPARKEIDKAGAAVLIVPADLVDHWRNAAGSDKHPLGKIAKPFLLQWALATLDVGNNPFLYVDPDVIAQRPLDDLVRHASSGWWMRSEETSLPNNHWAMSQLARAVALNLLSPAQRTSECREFNTGVIASTAVHARKVLQQWTDQILNAPWNGLRFNDLGKNNAWHDQDYFRALIRTANFPFAINEFNSREVIHLCANGHRWMVPLKDRYVNLRTLSAPTLVHFAGGTWSRFRNMRRRYAAFDRLHSQGLR